MATVQALESVQIGALPFEKFEDILEPGQWRQVSDAADRARDLFAGRVIWNVNSTSRGGGVAEMLVSLLAYARGVGVNTRWEVISGNPDFFALTKRIHNNLHGAPGDGGDLGERERGIYAAALEPNIRQFTGMVSPRDVVIVHDPQPAGLVGPLVDMGVPVIWRCHVGLDAPNELTRKAWSFLRPYVAKANALVFSRKAFVWEDLPDDRISIIAPSIDAFSPKNQELPAENVKAILEAAGIYADGHEIGDALFTRVDGSPARVARQGPALAGRAAVRGRPLRAPGLALGPAEGPARGHPGLRRPHRARRPTPTWSTPARRSRRSPTTPRARRSSPRPGTCSTASTPRCRNASTSRRCRWATSRRTRPSSTPCSATPPSWCRRAWPRASG